jgi:hypothetical protein
VSRDLEAMHASMVSYESYLVEQNNEQSARHLSGQAVRPPAFGLAGETFGSSPTTPFAYLSLRDALSSFSTCTRRSTSAISSLPRCPRTCRSSRVRSN